MDYRRMTLPEDEEVPLLNAILRSSEVARYLSIDSENYWNYVTSTEGVGYFKAYDGGQLVGALHLEVSGRTLFLSIMVAPKAQRRGYATAMLRDVQSGRFPVDFDEISVSIDVGNLASVALFTKMGFTPVSSDGELRNYIYRRQA